MELATVVLKLSGQTGNTVVKKDVTPAQLAVWAYMHGEDCAESITVTGVESKRGIPQEMERLRAEFTSDHAQKCLHDLFPGRFPQLPTTFRSIGFNPEELVAETSTAAISYTPKNHVENSIVQKIKEGSPERVSAQAANTANVAPVSAQERADLLDDTGADDDDDGSMPDDPLDAEINRLQNEGGAH